MRLVAIAALCFAVGVWAQQAHAGSPSTIDDVAVASLTRELGTDNFAIEDLSPKNLADGQIEVKVQLGEKQHLMVLRRHSVRSPTFRVMVQSEEGELRPVNVPAPRTYRGELVGVEGSEVVASVVRGSMTATVRMGDSEENTWAVRPLNKVVAQSPVDRHVIYRVEDASLPTGTCGTLDTHEHEAPLLANPRKSSAIGVAVAEIACDADYEFFVANNSSVDDTVADIEMIMNGVSAIYELDLQTTFEISTIIVRSDEVDPYTSSNPDTLLDQFRTQWVNNHSDVNRDLAHLFTGRDLDGTVLGIAWRGNLCNLLSFGLSQSRFTSDLSLRIAVTSHEIGHNFDAGHCDYGDWWCRIMCSGIGGCAGHNSFSPLAVDWMRPYMEEAACLDYGTAEPVHAPLPFYDDFDYSGDLDTSLWTGVDGAYLSTAGGIEPSGTRSVRLNEYDTMRTLPIVVREPVIISYWTNHDDVEAGSASISKSLMVEYYDERVGTWKVLEQIFSDGINTNEFTYHEHAAPADSYGDLFALRFSGWGYSADSSDKWYVDDVKVTPVPVDGDIDADDDVDVDDFAAFEPCIAGPNDSVVPAECTVQRFGYSDIDDDGDVDLADYSGLTFVMTAGAECGDGYRQDGEYCDDKGESADCDSDCTFAYCGDGQINAVAGETCDDMGESAMCDPDCTDRVCGDGYINATAGETCDDEGETETCDTDCTEAYCGDGHVNATRNEECDDAGNSVDCDFDCTFAECLDGFRNSAAGEECDHGAESETRDDDCTHVECGDGNLNETAGEECDDGNTEPGDGCSPACTLAEILPNCTITFDDGCPGMPDPICDTIFFLDGWCTTPSGCVHTAPEAYMIEGDEGGEDGEEDKGTAIIEFGGDVFSLSFYFWGPPGTEAEMMFFDEQHWEVHPLVYPDVCFSGVPYQQTLYFTQPVRFIEVNTIIGPVYIDTMEINPPER